VYLIPYLDPQLLKALVLVLQELQRLLALILHEDEFGAGDVEEPGNVVRISNVVLLTNIAQCLEEALQKPLFPSRIEQNCSVRFFFTTSKNGVFLPSK
jgi:hypothetical protein